MTYKIDRKKRIYKWLAVIVIVGVIGVFASVLFARNFFNQNIQPVSSKQTLVEVTIEAGSSLKDVSQLLKSKELIRNKRIFEQYVRNNGASQDIQAGTYELSPSYGVPEIVSILTQGKIVSKLVTILPGARLDQVQTMLVNAGFSEAEAKEALNPENYKNHPALTDKPESASLEGYLYPESFERTSSTTAQQIITDSLDEMNKRLTPEIKQAFVAQNLTTHQAITLASIVEKQVSSDSDRQQVAQVFLKRLKENIKLQSDATAKYGAVLEGVSDSLNQSQTLKFDSAYNTYNNFGLTPGPISNVTQSSLMAVAHPASTDWLYFVSGDDGITYFSRTLAEHEALVQQHCKKNCGL